ncbi:MAG TPA: hypothetical protein VHE99_06325, partial [Gammaproteobacteria bacterium]|nr:hypothetical protein [Gammaproteobacteria bacterium]
SGVIAGSSSCYFCFLRNLKIHDLPALATDLAYFFQINPAKKWLKSSSSVQLYTDFDHNLMLALCST